VAAANVPIYGVSTGFGELVHNWVDIEHGRALQENLLRSHCAGVGPLFSRDEVRAMMVARANALARGYSAVRPAVIEQLLKYLEAGITPAVPQVGSLGASGDLAPLSHVAITLIGEGKVLTDDGGTAPTAEVLRERGITPLALARGRAGADQRDIGHDRGVVPVAGDAARAGPAGRDHRGAGARRTIRLGRCLHGPWARHRQTASGTDPLGGEHARCWPIRRGFPDMANCPPR
jgi:hypothetical protein